MFALLLWKFLKLSYTDLPFIILLSIIPDIDLPNSFLGKIFRKTSEWLYVNFGHRTFTHSIFFATIILTPFYMLKFHFLASAIGLLSHLILDMLTFIGIQLLWPTEINFVIIGKIKSGSKIELLLSVIFIMLWWVG